MPKINKPLSQDGMIKELVRDYSSEALSLLIPELVSEYGPPVRCSFAMQESKKYSHRDPTRINDLGIIYTFNRKRTKVLLLLDHCSDKNKFLPHRLAHYFIDIDAEYLGYEKIPIALFTDRSGTWRKQPRKTIIVCCLGKEYFRFCWHCIRMKDYQADDFRTSKNRFIAVMRAAMSWDKKQKVELGIDFFTRYAQLENDKRLLRKHFEVIEYYLDLNKAERKKIYQAFKGNRRTKMLLQEILNEGMQKGIQKGIKEGTIKGKIEGKIEVARAMLARGIPVKEILEITRLTRKHLTAAGLIKNSRMQ